MNCKSCGHSSKAHFSFARCGVQKCECRNFNFPEHIQWYKVTAVHDSDHIELWDGQSYAEQRADGTDKAGGKLTTTYTIRDHELQVGDEVILSIVYVRRQPSE